MSRLAILILTRNEEAHIEACIKSASFADEIVVIDSGSTDKTQAIAESMGRSSSRIRWEMMALLVSGILP